MASWGSRLLAALVGGGAAILVHYPIAFLIQTSLMGALAWSLLGSPSGGFLNQAWRALGGTGHLIDINSAWGIAWVMALFEGSVAFVMIGAVMKSMDPALEEASQVPVSYTHLRAHETPEH